MQCSTVTAFMKVKFKFMSGFIQGFGEKPQGRRPVGRLNVDGRIILKWSFEKWDGGMDRIDLDQFMDRWRGLVNAVMNLRVELNGRTC